MRVKTTTKIRKQLQRHEKQLQKRQKQPQRQTNTESHNNPKETEFTTYKKKKKRGKHTKQPQSYYTQLQ